MSGLTVEQLLEEQKRSTNLAVLKAIPNDSEHVRVIPWQPGMKCLCGKGMVVPRKAIESLQKRDETVRCCGESLQVVEITFSSEKLVTYTEYFGVHRTLQTAMRFQEGRRRRLSFALTADTDSAGGGSSSNPFDYDPFEDPQTMFDCMANCIAEVNEDAMSIPPDKRAAFKARRIRMCQFACTGQGF